MGHFLETMKHAKGSWLLLVGLAAGLLLVFLGGNEWTSSAESLASDTQEGYPETNDYIASLERRVCQLLEAMDGVSEVSVIITPDGTGETVYAQNGHYESGILTEREYVITDGNGNDKPILIRLIYPKLRGIAVVCRGGSNPILQEKIVSLLCALFDLSANKVYVTG